MTTQFNQSKPQSYDPNYTPLIRDTKILNLSTQSSSGYLLNGDSKSKAYYELKNYIDYENDDSVEYISVSMPYVVLCNSCYIINETNNRLDVQYININDPNDVANASYTFPIGNYNANTFANAFLTTTGYSIGLRVDSLTQKHEIQFKFNHGVVLSSSTIDYIMGFSENVECPYLTWTKFPRCYNYLPTPRFNICCDFLNNGTLLTNDSRFGNSTVLASVPNNSKNNSLIVYESDANEFILKNLTLNTLTISIQDDNGNLVNFNGIASYFQLRFSIFRKRIPKLLPFKQLVDLANTNTDIFSEETQSLTYS